MLKNLTKIFARQIDLQKITSRGIFSTGRLLANDTKDSEGKADESESEQKPAEVPTILVEKDGPITLIGINRPQQRNAINAATATKLCEAFTEFENDDTSPVAVLYGTGGSFCSGYDIQELGTDGDKISLDLLMQAEGSVGPTRRHISKPVVCGINGYCVANGLELALMCDLRVMEESAILGFFNRRFGVPVIDGGTARLPSLIGFSRALDLILTGRQVNSKEALEIGLVNRVVATGTALGQAVNLAYSISKFPQAALLHDRNSLYSATFEAHNFNMAVQNEIMYTSKEVIEEMKAGVKKFNEGHFRAGKTEGVKEKPISDWEKEEIELEKKSKGEEKSEVKKEKSMADWGKEDSEEKAGKREEEDATPKK